MSDRLAGCLSGWLDVVVDGPSEKHFTELEPALASLKLPQVYFLLQKVRQQLNDYLLQFAQCDDNRYQLRGFSAGPKMIGHHWLFDRIPRALYVFRCAFVMRTHTRCLTRVCVISGFSTFVFEIFEVPDRVICCNKIMHFPLFFPALF